MFVSELEECVTKQVWGFYIFDDFSNSLICDPHHGFNQQCFFFVNNFQIVRTSTKSCWIVQQSAQSKLNTYSQYDSTWVVPVACRGAYCMVPLTTGGSSVVAVIPLSWPGKSLRRKSHREEAPSICLIDGQQNQLHLGKVSSEAMLTI